MAQPHQSDDGKWPEAPSPEQPPPGTCTVAYRRARIVERFNRMVAELTFEIADPGKWTGELVTMYCALPKSGPAPRQSKFYQQWTLANGKPPNRRDRMSPRVFAGYWIARLGRTKQVMTQTDEGYERRALAEGEAGETVVEQLLERSAGGPKTFDNATAKRRVHGSDPRTLG